MLNLERCCCNSTGLRRLAKVKGEKLGKEIRINKNTSKAKARFSYYDISDDKWTEQKARKKMMG
jgi:hypothetical protein